MYIAAGVVLIALAVFFGWAYGKSRHHEGVLSERLAHERAMSALRAQHQKQVDAAASNYERWRASQAPLRVATTIREIYRDVPVDTGCGLDAAVVSVLQDAVAAANADIAGESRPALRTAPTSGGE